MLTIPMAQSDGDLNSSRPAECTEFKGPVSKRLRDEAIMAYFIVLSRNLLKVSEKTKITSDGSFCVLSEIQS
jgi:hypothetical protein